MNWNIGILLFVFIGVLICNICSTELKSVKVTLCYKADVMKSQINKLIFISCGNSTSPENRDFWRYLVNIHV